jgi:TatD DNase family protein
MIFYDTHAHLYLEEFAGDRNETVQRAINSGVSRMALPNIDNTSWAPMLELCGRFPENCFPMAGLHPTSVNKDTVEKELQLVETWLGKQNFVAIGEIGIDLYWDKTFLTEQQAAFRHQLRLAKQYGLPIVIHTRNSFEEVYSIVKEEAAAGLTGVFHCFSGNLAQAVKVIDLGFYLGIGGVVTYKNSGLQQVVQAVGCSSLVLETDAPFLSPVPWRGKRNESAYIPLVAEHIAGLLSIGTEEVAAVTTSNAQKLFKR